MNNRIDKPILVLGKITNVGNSGNGKVHTSMKYWITDPCSQNIKIYCCGQL